MPKRKKSDQALDAFIRTLSSWDGKKPSFQNLVISAAEHCAAIAERTGDGTAFVAEFATLTNWPPASIRGWMRGHNLPNNALAKSIAIDLRIYMSKKIAPTDSGAN